MEPIVFIDLARESFQPVVSIYHMVLSLCSNGIVKYQNDTVFLKITYDYGNSYELSIYIGRIMTRQQSAEEFELQTILRMKQVPDNYSGNAFQAIDEVVLKRKLLTLASQVEQYCSELLAGENEAFEQLRTFQLQVNDNYQKANEMRFARQDADRAWTEKRYIDVVTAYRPVKQYLSPAELKKLGLAYKLAEISGLSKSERRY